MTTPKKLSIAFMVAAAITLAPNPAQAQGGFFKRLLGGAAEMVVPGAGGLIHAIGDEVDGTNDRLRKEEADRKAAEAHERSEEVRRQVRAEVEAEVRAEQRAQEAQKPSTPTTAAERVEAMKMMQLLLGGPQGGGGRGIQPGQAYPRCSQYQGPPCTPAPIPVGVDFGRNLPGPTRFGDPTR